MPRSQIASGIGLALGIGAAGTLAVHCGGAPSQPSAVSGTPAAPTAIIAAAPNEPPDLTPVAEPQHLVALARWVNPAKSLDTAGQWVGMPITPSMLVDMLDAQQIADAIAYDQPIDVALTLDPKGASSASDPLMAVAIGLKSLDVAKEAFKSADGVTQVGPGIFEVSSRMPRSGAACFIAASAGGARARLVCGSEKRDAQELLPYLTRTLPLQHFGPADLHAEMRLLPLEKAFGPTLQQGARMFAAMTTAKLLIDEPVFDDALRRGAMALGEEVGRLVHDADLLTMDVDLGAEATDVALHAKMRAHHSWVAGTLLSLEKNQGAAPAVFWQMPVDATSGSFYHPSDPARWTDIFMVLSQLAEGWLRHSGVPAAGRASVSTLLDPSRLVSATNVAASGTSNGSGWHIMVVDEADKSVEAFRNLALAWNRPKLRALIDKQILSALEIETIGLRMTPPPAGLPKGAIDIEASVSWPRHAGPGQKTDKSRAKVGESKPKQWSGHLLAFSDNGRSWFGLGKDRKTLVKILLATKDARPPGGSDDANHRPELARLGSDRVAAGGYFTLAGLFDGVAGDALTTNAPQAAEFLRLLRRGPHQGRAPATYALAVSTQGALTLTTSFHIPKAMVEDVVVAAASIPR